jgi:hypothetical protein
VSDKAPDPEGIYEAVQGFTTKLEPGGPDVDVRGGWRTTGSDPLVIKHPELFRLAPDDIIRRQQGQIRDLLESRDVGETGSGAPGETSGEAHTDAPSDTPQEPARQRGPDPDATVPAEAVRAEKRRRIEAGEPSGYDALARHFGVSPSTIRRRLSKL